MSLVQITTKPKAAGPKYWRSLDQVADTPEFRQWVEREFPSAAAEMLDGKSRRHMLKLMAASFGMAGLAACSRPELRFAPQVRAQMDYVPGHPYNYTTAFALNGQATGLVVETYDGRPHKIEGNPDHPVSQGAATALMQASVLDVYDPDRSKTVTSGGQPSTWEEFEASLRGLDLSNGLRILSETVISPTLESLRAQLLAKFPNARWVEYDAVSRENERAGTVLAFGQPLNVHPQFDRARVIVSLDHDFLGLDTPAPLATKLFSRRRRVESEEDLERLSRLYVVESQFSLTGANAEHRLRVKGSEVRQFARDLLAALSTPPAGEDRRAKFLAAAAADLRAAGAEALVVAGPRQPAIVHALAHQINQALGANGKTVTFTAAPRPDRVSAGVEALAALAGEMNNGQVSTLLILGGNPVYTAPRDLDFGAALAKVPNSIHLGQSVDETAAACKWHLPEAHYLEAWGDARSTSGVAAVQQPMIEPIYGGRSAIEVLAQALDLPEKKGYQLVKNYWMLRLPEAGKENAWRKALHDGVISGPAANVTPSLNAAQITAALGNAAAAPAGLEVAFVPSAAVWDGRFANNAWMQETPDPITKLVWTNAVMVSPAMAREQGLENGSIVTLSQGDTRLEAAVMIQPGQAEGAVTLALGYGRTRAGNVGKDVGYNANLIRTTDGFWYKSGFSLTPTGAKTTLATTQEHGTMQEPEELGGKVRPVYREVTLEEYKREPRAIEEMVEVPELASVHPAVADYSSGYQWGMAIDLGACTGCNACVVACQAENNVPVVGKEQVARGREMHWLRVDRYYVGDEEEPRAVEQPIPCMQCENAPCEYVCPVAATTHSPEGLNDMAYNRCVGTRYCSNNCPYKVRHFNFLNFHKKDPDILAMVQNPEVTVRMRGVMEKCTYCVQRIEAARIAAKVDGRREIREGDVVTACQQTCPADAIAFGNINDPGSRVSKLKKQERNYALLAELKVRPRTTYLGRLRNVNPSLETEA